MLFFTTFFEGNINPPFSFFFYLLTTNILGTVKTLKILKSIKSIKSFARHNKTWLANPKP